MTKVKDQIRWLETQYDPEQEIATTVWSYEDVFHQAEQYKKGMTKELAEEIIELVDQHHDANYGFSWTTIDCAMDEFNLPTFWKLYWRSEDGNRCSYDVDKERTIYMMIDAESDNPEEHAWQLGFWLLKQKELDTILEHDTDFWTIVELDREDPFWEETEETEEVNNLYDLLVSSVVLGVDGNHVPFYAIPRCPKCGLILDEIDELFTDMYRWTWDHEINTIIARKQIGEPDTKYYECPKCSHQVSELFWQYRVAWNV